MNIKWFSPAKIYLAGTVNKETGILTIISQTNKDSFALINEQGIYVAGVGNPAWTDDFVDACVNAGYDVVSWEYKKATISEGEKLPFWDTYVLV